MPTLSFPELLLIITALAVAAALLVFWIWMLVDSLRSERHSGTERLVWVVVIVFLKLIGALIYFFMQYCPRRAARSG